MKDVKVKPSNKGAMYCKKTRNDCKQCVISSAGVCPGSNNSGTEMSCNDLTVCVIVNERTTEAK